MELKYIFLITVVFIAACVETDIYLPAFPDMMRWFGVTEGEIQGLLTWNFVGICVAGPFYGPISDALGRKRPLLLALILFFIGSLITIFANTLPTMLVGRILQGVGSGGCFTLGTAILFDAFQKEKAIKALNQLNLIIPLVMAIAPLVGGYLNLSFGFRSNFIAIALFVLVSLIISIAFFEETLPKEKRPALNLRSIARDFKRVFTCLSFWQLTFVICVIFAGYIAFLSASSLLFVVEFGMSKKIFPFIQGAILGGWVAGSLSLNRSLKRLGYTRIKQAGIALTILGGLSIGVITLFAPTNPYLFTLGMMLYAFGANWVIGLYFPEGMEILPDIKGITASLMTSARLLIASLTVSFVSFCYNGTIYPLAFIVMATVVIFVPLLFFYERKAKPVTTPSKEIINH